MDSSEIDWRAGDETPSSLNLVEFEQGLPVDAVVAPPANQKGNKMSQTPRYFVVTPARNEEANLPLTIRSMVAQRIIPTMWVIVNDGSTDRTGKIVQETAAAYAWIVGVNRPDRGYRKAGGGVIDTFYEGYRLVQNEDWDYLVKLDSDLSFGSDYFERCFKQFDLNPRLGIVGGTICTEGGEVESKVDPRFHVRGATKIYRRACWRDIGGLIHAPGWDTLDEIKANMLGWVTYTVPEIKATQHRPTGAAYGVWNDKVKGGLANYIAGYHPLFMFLKCVRRMVEKPYFIGGFGLWFGFVKGYITRVPRVPDKALIEYFREQQINRLFRRKSLWS
jgi:biofilm PGA synthesis N-glycosyltransferase PgaC